MKKPFFTIAILCLSSHCLASDEVTIKPGSEIRVEKDTLVKCEAQRNELPRCVIRNKYDSGDSSYWKIMYEYEFKKNGFFPKKKKKEDVIFESGLSYELAVKIVGELRKLGMCI